MRRAVFACALLALSLRGAALEAKPFEEMLPEGTSFFFTIRSLKDFQGAVKNVGLADLWNDPEMRPFARGVDDIIARAGEQMQKKLGLKPAELLDLWQGEIGFALGDPASIAEGKKNEVPLALLIDVGERKDRARDLIRKAVELSKLRKRETEFRGDTIFTLEDPQKSEAKEAAPEPELSMTLAGELLAIGFSRPYLQDILAGRGDPALKSLDESADFKFLRERHGRDSWLFAYVNLGRWLEQFPRLLQASGGAAAGPMSGLFTKVIADILGIGSFRAFSFAQFHKEDTEEATAFAIQSGPLRGFMKTLSSKPESIRFPSVIPRDAREAYVFLLDWNGFAAALEEALQMARTFAPMLSGDGDESPLEVIEKELGVKIKEDLLGPLGGKVSLFQAVPRTVGQDEYAFLVELRDRERVEETFGKLMAKAGLPRKEYLGHPVWSTASGGEGGGDASEMAICVGGSHLIVATPRLVEEVARREGKEVESLNDLPAYKALASRVPGSMTFLSYSSPEVIEDIIAQIKAIPGEIELEDGDDEEDGSDAAEPGAPPRKSSKDESAAEMEKLGEDFLKLLQKLPSGKGLGKHLPASVSWGFVEEKGMGGRQVYGRRGAASR